MGSSLHSYGTLNDPDTVNCMMKRNRNRMKRFHFLRKQLNLLYTSPPLCVEQRKQIWMRSKGIQFVYVEQYYQQCLNWFNKQNELNWPIVSSQLEQIELDLNRIGHDYVQVVDQSKLSNICKAICAHGQGSGYTQGMNVLAAKLLTMLGQSELESFWALVYICTFGYFSSFNHPSAFKDSLLVKDSKLIDAMLDEWVIPPKNESLLSLAQRFDLDSNMYSIVPLVMLMSHEGGGYNLKMEDSDRLWDYMFTESHQFVILCSIVTAFIVCSPFLVNANDHSEAMDILHNTPLLARTPCTADTSYTEAAEVGRVASSGCFVTILQRVMRKMEHFRTKHKQEHLQQLVVERQYIEEQMKQFSGIECQ